MTTLADENPSETDLKLETVKVDVEDGIAWVTLNRPDKRNAMSPTLNREMFEVLEALEFDDRVKVLVLTGAGEAFTAGMDLKEYFREVQGLPLHAAKIAYKHSHDLPWDVSEDYLVAKAAQARMTDTEAGSQKGMKQFLDDKTFRPGLETYQRDARGN